MSEQSFYKIWSLNVCLRTSFGGYNSGFKASWVYYHFTSKIKPGMG